MDLSANEDRSPGAPTGPEDDSGIGARAPALGAAARLGLLALAALLAVALATAGRLRPDPRGYGTHEQLGRPPCAILRLTGRPCPTCGLTTAFAYFVRADLPGSWRANPAGLAVASASVLLIPWLLACSACGRPLVVRSAGGPLMALVVVAAALAVLTWSVRRSLSLI